MRVMICAGSQMVDVTSTELVLTSSESLRLKCVGDASIVWFHQRRIIVSRVSATATCSLSPVLCHVYLSTELG